MTTNTGIIINSIRIIDKLWYKDQIVVFLDLCALYVYLHYIRVFTLFYMQTHAINKFKHLCIHVWI